MSLFSLSALVRHCLLSGSPPLLRPPKRYTIEVFRYGTSPSIIRANRGDRLILTFSTRDTGHSFFLQDYRIDAKITPASETVEVRDPLQPAEPPSYLKEVELKAGLSGFWGSLVSISRFRCHVYCGPMHGFEQGDLIVRPNWLLAGSMGLLLAIVLIGCLRVRLESPATGALPRPPIDLNKRFVLLDKILKWRPLQFTFTLPLLAGLMVVVLAGFFGTKVGGRNLAVMLTWIVWISLLALFLVPLGRKDLVHDLPFAGYGRISAAMRDNPGAYGKERQVRKSFYRIVQAVAPGSTWPVVATFFVFGSGHIQRLPGRPAQMDRHDAHAHGGGRDIHVPHLGTPLLLQICLSGGRLYFGIQRPGSAHGPKERC